MDPNDPAVAAVAAQKTVRQRKTRSPYGKEVTHRDSARPEFLGFSAEEVRARLKQYDRMPFIELLAGWLECMPSADAISAFAERAPDKYIASLVQIARVAGFTEKTETEVNVNVAISKMSDSQIEDKLREVTGRLGLPMPKMPGVIDVVAEPTSEASRHGAENENSESGA
jgi:hypothetical protein